MLGSRNRKERKRLVALLLAGIMVLSGSGISPISVQAEGEAAAVVETSAVSDGNAEVTPGEEAGTVSGGNTETKYDPSKIDVWDFGAEQLDTSVYNNMLNADVINSWFPGVEAGTKGKNIASFKSGDLAFNDGGYSATHRLRSTNAALTRYDDKSKKDAAGVNYTGYIYSNKGATKDVYLGLNVTKGDKVTYLVSTNGTDGTYVWEAPSGEVQSREYVAGTDAKLQALTFYATEDGQYKLYTSKEKMVVARIYREHTNEVTVSGKVTAPTGLADFSVIFTNTASGEATEAEVVKGQYSVALKDGYSYDVTLKNANGYVITSDTTLDLEKGAAATAFDVKISGVSLFTVSGKVKGLSEEALKAVKITAKTDEIYVPEIKITGDEYTVQLESGITYDLEAEGVNDYTLVSPTSLKATEDKTVDLEFEEKPVYAVTLDIQGADKAQLANAVFTFTNLKEEGYVYSFTGTEGITLRDGTYSVVASETGAYVQKLTSNLKVDGAAVTKTISFSGDISSWEFNAKDFTAAGYTDATKTYNYNGLGFTGGKAHNNTYLLMGAGKVTVPVKGACQIKVTSCYQYSFYFESEDEDSVGKKTGSTGQLDTFTYDYKGEAGTVTITFLGSSYVNKIEVVETVALKTDISVGQKGDYQTVNEALEAVRKMDRSNNERVTISIEPGNYEEMLVVDVPNVTLKNSSAKPSTDLTNKGVDIAAEAVRITSYYGHGYSYYSMGNDCKWNEETLKVNKENGYESYTNPGSGTTNGSYWNATVVVAADGFEAEGIIFENSFNQYVSKKAAEDVIVAQSGAKEGAVARANMKEGDTTVQDKKYVERAAALAIQNNIKQVSFDNCKFVGRQDTLYGGTGVTVAFYDCSVYGGTDYIFGGMTAVFAKCDLVFNTSEDGNDVGYITAPQQKSGRGYLMYNCHVTSTVPGEDTASEYTSKAGYFGRPWQANTSEAVFYQTVVDATCEQYFETTPSMIAKDGWSTTLGGQSALCVEYGTYEMAKDVDNSSARVDWTTVLKEPKLADGTEISVKAFLGDWDAFAGKDMTVVIPDEKVDNTPKKDPETPSETTEFVLETSALKDFASGAKKDGDEEKAGTENYFTLIYSAKTKVDSSSKTFDDGYTSGQRVNFGGVASTEKNAVKFTTSNAATVTVWWAEGGDDNRQMGILDASGKTVSTTSVTLAKNAACISKFKLEEAGTYYLGGATNNNYIFKVVVTEEKAAEPVISTLETSALKDFAQGAKKDGDEEKAGTNEYFTLIYSAKTKVDSSSKTFDDGYSSKQRVNFGDVVSTDKNAIKFTTSNAATVKIWWAEGGDNNRQMAILNASGTTVAQTKDTLAKNAACVSTLELTKAGTYYLGSIIGNNYIFKVEVTEKAGGSVKPPRAEWSTVTAPVITKAEQVKGDVVVTVNANVGYDGADKITVTLKDADGNDVASKNSSAEKETHEVLLTPNKSGTYTVSVVVVREGEENKAGNSMEVTYSLPLATPAISSATSKGNGTVEVVWSAVKEATGYAVTATAEGENEVSKVVTADETTVLLEGLAVGKTYTISVVAVRGTENSEAGKTTVKMTAEAQRVWSKSTYGSSTDSKNNGVIGNANDGKVTVYSEGGKGKIVPGSTDGLTFYYTAIDPETENFTLTADIHVDSWTLSNGQEGFGMMAADAVGSNGDGTAFWNNAYQAIATKVEYYWDGEDVTTDSSANKISMKLGLGAISRLGVTADDVAAIKNGTITMPAGYVSETTTLETGAATKGPGTYNLVGNWNKKAEPTGNLENLLTDFRLQIQRNNTGYYLRYLDKDNKVIKEVRYYDLERTSLTQIDKDNIYVGFFASRNARITVSNIDLKTIKPADDEKAEEREIEYVYPINTIESPAFSNSADYNLVYYGNADGTLVVKDQNGKEVLNKEFKALTKETVALKLNSGKNAFTINFIPDKEYKPGEFKLMTSYDPVTINHTVEYKTVENNNIYVSPNGKSNAAGTKDAPMDIYTAVKIAAPGQKILIKEGTYNLSRTVKVERGINGTADAMIYMIADPEAGSRPIFDFGGKCAGMILAGDYWYFQGFDVTRSADAQKGIQVSGNHNTLDRIKAYRNGNTGIQISRYLGTDQFDQWPAHNTILNCSSYLNADKGYEDADGFAAKLTVGQGNVFDGCIAAYNADDGWDLFAKVQSGSIGVVTIQNCVAFKNGYILDENGREINAGNGNGFKMGGDSMPGAHVLKNSVAFANKAKGIDSNSCPDIKVYSSTTFDNESYNVAFYTNTAVNTAFAADGILSYKVSNKVAEQFKLLGTQNAADVKGATNYYFDGSKSVNNNGKEATASWFKSLDTASALKDGGITRNADGTINMNGFLELTDEVPEGVGARMSGRISGDITVAPDEPKQDDSKPENNNNNNNNNNNSNDNGSGSAGASSAPETVNWNEVSSSVQDKVTELAQNPAIAMVNMNVVCTGEVQVPQKVLNTIKGTNVTVAFHSGNGVAMSISGQDLKNKDLSKIQNIDLTVDQTSNNIPANVVAAKTSAPTRQLAIKDTGSFGVNVNIHVNVGKENAGKTANLYRYNAEKGRLEYCGSFTVTSNGQSMFALKRGGNYLVTVTERRPSESVWFAEGNYIVKAGDTLSKIAQRNHMTLTELLRRNAQITNRNLIKVGQRLNLN